MTTETMTSFAPLMDACQEYDQLKSDAIHSTEELSFNGLGQLVLPAGLGLMAVNMEDLALNQLAGRLGKTYWNQPTRTIPTDFYRQMSREWPGQFSNLTNALLAQTDGKLLVRMFDDSARAILSDQYVTLDNSQVLDMASQVLDGLDYEIVQSGKYYSRNDGVQRDEMTVRVVVKTVLPPEDPDGGSYGIGVLIRNGETGSAASEIRPLVMRHSCMNSIVFKTGENGEKLGLKLTHRGIKVAKVNLLASAIAEALPMAADGLERFLALQTQQIDLAGVIGKLGDDKGWGEEMKLKISVGTEGRSNLFGLVNGLTYAAHELDVDQTTRLDLESMAAVIVHNPKSVPTVI